MLKKRKHNIYTPFEVTASFTIQSAITVSKFIVIATETANRVSILIMLVFHKKLPLLIIFFLKIRLQMNFWLNKFEK